MPPALSNKRKAPPGGSASAAAGRAAAAPGEQPANAERGLQPGLVKEFLEMIQRRDRLGPECLNDDERRQWDEYLDSVPASAEESADGKSLVPVQMPAKCKPRASASGAGSSTSRSQQEIITYSNAGGRQFHTGDRQRQHAASKPMRAADVPVGSTVAIRKEASSVGCQPGYRTPFDVGDVVGADIDAHGVVQKLSIHFRMPQGADGLFVDELGAIQHEADQRALAQVNYYNRALQQVCAGAYVHLSHHGICGVDVLDSAAALPCPPCIERPHNAHIVPLTIWQSTEEFLVNGIPSQAAGSLGCCCTAL